MLQVEGAKLFVDKIPGHGDRNFVLIHNAGGDHRFFRYQIETLKKYGNVVLLDLPGHGESESTGNCAMSDLARLVAQICQKLSLTNISLIGLNNGADIAIEIETHRHLTLSSLVLIDPPVLMDPSFVEEIKTFVEQLEKPGYSQFIVDMVDALFVRTDLVNKEFATNAFHKVDRKSLQKVFNGLIEWDRTSIELIKKIACPTMCVLTDEHHCSYEKLRRVAPQIEIGKVIGSKCWATLDVPVQINAMLERHVNLLDRT